MKQKLELKHPFSLVVVGKKRHGKTTFVKKILQKYDKEKVVVYDPNNEYRGLSRNRYRFYENLKLDLENYRNCCIVIEDATAQLSNRLGNEEILNILIRTRHLNSSVIMIFHSLRSVPVQIFDNIDKIVAFRTNDRVDLIKKKFEGILGESDIQEIRNLPPFHFVIHNF